MKTSVRWLLFECQGLGLAILSNRSRPKSWQRKRVSNIPTVPDWKIEIGVVRVPSVR